MTDFELLQEIQEIPGLKDLLIRMTGLNIYREYSYLTVLAIALESYKLGANKNE